MADRYWVGGTGVWSDAANHWAATSGGAPNAANLPTQNDIVHIDSSSGFGSGGTIGLDGSYGSTKCHDFISNSGHNYNIDYNTSDLYVYGSATLEAGITWVDSAWIIMAGSTPETITFNGNTCEYVYCEGNGVTVTFTDEANITDDLYIEVGDSVILGPGDNTIGDQLMIFGTFDANDNNITCARVGGTAGTISMGSGIWTITGSGTIWTVGSGATLNAETSTIKITNATATQKTFNGAGKTFYDLWITGSGTGTYTINGENTFNRFRVDTPPHTIYFEMLKTQTVAYWDVKGSPGNEITILSTTAVPDSYQGSWDNSWWLHALDITRAGQSFTGNGGIITDANVSLWELGTPPGNCWLEIYAETHATAFGTDSLPTGAPLATSDVRTAAGLTGNNVVFNFTGANRITLTNGTKYVLVFAYLSGDNGNRKELGFDNTSPGHAGNPCYYVSSWIAVTDRDLRFSITTVGAHTLSKPGGRVVSQHMNITNSIATGGAKWFAGSKSTNTVGPVANSGWQFKDPPHDLTLLGVGT